jgi:hypothetical protein
VNRYRDSLKAYKFNFLLVTVLFLAVSTACALQERERRFLDRQQKELVRAKEGLTRVRAAILDYRSALVTLKAHYTEETVKATPASQIYSRVDELVARYKPDETVFGTLEKNGDNASLNYTLSFINRDYGILLDTISQLQCNVFPFTPVDSITISQKEHQGRGAVICAISGRVTSMEGPRP